MKVRLGFVSNSSTSSFIINRCHLSENQIEMIRDHIAIGAKEGIRCATSDDAWNITVTEQTVSGDTLMDNFDMGFFLKNIVGVEDKHVQWGDPIWGNEGR